MKARELMTPDPECVTADESISRVAKLMRDRNVGIIPVVDDRDGRHLQGVITDRDIAVRHVAEGHTQDCRVGDHMTRDRLDTVNPDSDLEEVYQKMERDQIRRIPVVEQDNRIVGIIAQADLAVRRGRQEPERVEQVVERISEPAEPTR